MMNNGATKLKNIFLRKGLGPSNIHIESYNLVIVGQGCNLRKYISNFEK
jgi:hypothetical protein